MKTTIKATLDTLKVSDIYSLMLFILYRIKDIPEYAVLSELCYLLDGNSVIRMLTYFSGRTITIPEQEDFLILTNALLLYQYVNIDKLSFIDAQAKLDGLTAKQKDQVTDLYVKIIPIINQYNVDRTQIGN